MNFPVWFFQATEDRIPVRVTRWLPFRRSDNHGNESEVHWTMFGGVLLMSQEAFHELKRVAASQEDERPIGRDEQQKEIMQPWDGQAEPT